MIYNTTSRRHADGWVTPSRWICYAILRAIAATLYHFDYAHYDAAPRRCHCFATRHAFISTLFAAIAATPRYAFAAISRDAAAAPCRRCCRHVGDISRRAATLTRHFATRDFR